MTEVTAAQQADGSTRVEAGRWTLFLHKDNRPGALWVAPRDGEVGNEFIVTVTDLIDLAALLAKIELAGPPSDAPRAFLSIDPGAGVSIDRAAVVAVQSHPLGSKVFLRGGCELVATMAPSTLLAKLGR